MKRLRSLLIVLSVVALFGCTAEVKPIFDSLKNDVFAP